MTSAATAGMRVTASIEVADVRLVYERAVARGEDVVYRLTDELWRVRRFFVRDPNGAVINVMQHLD